MTVAGDYSTTNVQVAGVDEADFVKNDGQYIYIISNGRLLIVDACPAENASVISETTFDGTPGDMLLNGDSLVIFTTGYSYTAYEKRGIISGIIEAISRESPPVHTGQVTHALIYSVKNREKPALEKDICADGTYFNSRMIGDLVYLITKEQIYYYDDPMTGPHGLIGLGKGHPAGHLLLRQPRIQLRVSHHHVLQTSMAARACSQRPISSGRRTPSTCQRTTSTSRTRRTRTLP